MDVLHRMFARRVRQLMTQKRLSVNRLAEFERKLIRERVVAGTAAAKRRGRRAGRRHARVDVAKARALKAAGASLRAIAADLGCSVGTLHRALAAA